MVSPGYKINIKANSQWLLLYSGLGTKRWSWITILRTPWMNALNIGVSIQRVVRQNISSSSKYMLSRERPKLWPIFIILTDYVWLADWKIKSSMQNWSDRIFRKDCLSLDRRNYSTEDSKVILNPHTTMY